MSGFKDAHPPALLPPPPQRGRNTERKKDAVTISWMTKVYFFVVVVFFALMGGKRNTLRWKIHRDSARFLLYGKPPLVWLHPLNWMKLNTIRGKPCADNCANRNVWLTRSGHKVWCGCWLVCRRHLRINLNAMWGSIGSIWLLSLGVICTRRLTIAC